MSPLKDKDSKLKERFKEILQEAKEEGYFIYISVGDKDIRRYFPENNPAAGIDIDKKHKIAKIVMNNAMYNSCDEEYYTTMAHEVGHIFESSTREEVIALNAKRYLGDEEAIQREIDADVYACRVSPRGHKEALEGCLRFYQPNSVGYKEIVRRVDVINTMYLDKR